uniref:ER membrane protein complex subunit 2 n=5 Tax=Neoaves TaxID=3078114 RepID=A0A8C3DCW6_CORMO
MAKVSEMYDVTWEDMRDKMRKWREENYRNSEQIVDVGEELINEYASKLGDDIWIIYEQVMIAALDCSRDDLALFCLQELRRQFPGSHRVKRLTGMRFEAMERYEDAIQLYDRILQEDSTNTAARKRKIAIRKAQGKNLEAIRELNEYLEQFVGDQEAWHELAELYINEHDYAKAAFCLEELMMTNPHNHLYCQQYAEVKYTQGGLENLELSRKYFAQALKLNNRNMRALFGLYMVSMIIYFPCYHFELSFAICCFVFSPCCFNLIAQIINTVLKYKVFYVHLEYGQFCASKYSLLEVLLTFKSCLYFQKNYNYWHRKVIS